MVSIFCFTNRHDPSRENENVVHLVNGCNVLSPACLGLLAVGYERMGSEALLKESPVDHLYDIYVKINAEADKDPSIHAAARQYFKRMEDGMCVRFYPIKRTNRVGSN